ncbi:hypothetical protein J3R83DRAFT_4074 [Lanmaoa asiatica]|nr:hypothetical protein J3R83DRAFT_4074 [Lanmaoa asiatica]
MFVVIQFITFSKSLHYLPPMQARASQLITQFTEDARATEDRICEREECELKDRKILKGLPIYYIGSS